MATRPGNLKADVDNRITIGAWVNQRLKANPRAYRIPCNDVLDIYIVRDFLDAAECADLIAQIDANNEPSKVLSFNGDPEFRTSHSCNVNPQDPTVIKVETKLTRLTGIEPAYGETIQGQRYQVGQQFKAHYDFFHKGEAYWDEMMKTGGQRTWTAMVFLNEVEGGGETNFPHASVKVTPRRGNLLAWNNMDLIGQPNSHALHQGCPVSAGTKYIITKWFRERPWTYSEVETY